MPLIVTAATTPAEMQQVMALRRRVFIDEQGFREAVETEDPNDDKPTTIHFLGHDSETNEYVAVARCLLDEPNRKAKFGRVAVLSECRGKNFGAQLMDGIEELVRSRVDKFVLSSQYGRKGFYLKCGYRCPSDEIYLEEGVKHCWMEKSATK
ncbi:putative acetyltransferase (GNAT) family [Phytophthora cinnamomi]|uniref:putative acetyltransferase (GNAT) family n=1 Tax=Phytophthora cinnamomi TaxID=4785 RepID=UPI00355AC9FB|nr:putative acetyltransferase (GNAT) family [Phytophthora cinnamomi]